VTRKETVIATPSKAPSPDAALVQRLRAGEDAAFEELVRMHGPRMLAVAQRYVRAGPDAEDVLQEAFVSVARGIASFHGDSKLTTWLHRIVVNCALMRLRARSRRPETLLSPETVSGHLESRPTTAWGLTAAEVIDRTDLRGAVQKALEGLPELDRAIVRLRDIQGMTLDEVSRLLDLGLTTVKEHLHRARHALRERLEPVLREARP
jgi:RNA polymerase sigma-70 factor (ECF subfamily)